MKTNYISNENYERLVKKAKYYDDLNEFIIEIGWEEWMNDFTDVEDYEIITEEDNEDIDEILKEVWNKAHKE